MYRNYELSNIIVNRLRIDLCYGLVNWFLKYQMRCRFNRQSEVSFWRYTETAFIVLTGSAQWSLSVANGSLFLIHKKLIMLDLAAICKKLWSVTDVNNWNFRSSLMAISGMRSLEKSFCDGDLARSRKSRADFSLCVCVWFSVSKIQMYIRFPHSFSICCLFV